MPYESLARAFLIDIDDSLISSLNKSATNAVTNHPTDAIACAASAQLKSISDGKTMSRPLIVAARDELTKEEQEAKARKPNIRRSLPGICEHGRQRSRCKECDGSGVCEHRKLRHYCKICCGSGICAHGRRKSDCKHCRGSSICEHGKQKRQCKECLAAYGACMHGKAKNRHCKLCGIVPPPSQSARAKPKFYDSAGIDSALRPSVSVSAAEIAVAPLEHLFSAPFPAATLLDPPVGEMLSSQALQPRIPLPCIVALNPSLIMSLPSALPMFNDPLGLNLFFAQANYASFVQLQNVQYAQYLQQHRSVGALNVLAPGPSLVHPFDRLLSSPYDNLQLPTSALQLATSVRLPYP
jgi:hypothetical protein